MSELDESFVSLLDDEEVFPDSGAISVKTQHDIEEIGRLKEGIIGQERFNQLIDRINMILDYQQNLMTICSCSIIFALFTYDPVKILLIISITVMGSFMFYYLQQARTLKFVSSGSIFSMIVYAKGQIISSVECIVDHWEIEKIQDSVKDELMEKAKEAALTHGADQPSSLRVYAIYTKNGFPKTHTIPGKPGKFGKFILVIPIDKNSKRTRLEDYISWSYGSIYIKNMWLDNQKYCLFICDIIAIINDIPRMMLFFGGQHIVNYHEYIQSAFWDSITDLYKMNLKLRMRVEFMKHQLSAYEQDRLHILSQVQRIIDLTKETTARMLGYQAKPIKGLLEEGSKVRNYAKSHPIITTTVVVGLVIFAFIVAWMIFSGTINIGV